ncbi:MAG: PAS domain S-box protein [Prosthecobacter sp.]
MRNQEIEVRTRYGVRKTVSLNAELIELAGTKCLMTLIEDITDRRRLEQKQVELVAIVESSEDAIIGKSLEGVITSWNRGAEHVFGHTAAEAVGQPLVMLFPPEREREEAEILAKIARGETVRHFETVRVRKDGRKIIISATISPLKDSGGRVIGASKIARDITAQKHAEEVLREKQAQLLRAMDIAKLAHWDFDVRKNRVSADEHIFHLLGTTVAEEGGLSMSPEEYIRRFVHPQDAGIVAGEVALGIATTDPNFARQFEHRVIRRDGAVRVMLVRARILMDGSGRPGKILGTNQDITEQKQAELRIRQLNRIYAVLSAINKTIVHEKDPQVMLAKTCRIAVETGGFRMAWAGMCEATTQTVRPVASAGVVEGYLDLLNIDLRAEERGMGPSGRCFLSGEHAACGDLEHAPFPEVRREEALRRGYRSSACFPLKVEGSVTGILSLYSGEPGFFDEEELRLLDEMALDIGFALEVSAGEARRRQAEQELRWRTAFFEAQVHSAVDGILVVDSEGRKLLQNRRLNELWKIPPPIADDPDDSIQVQFVLGRVREPEAFAKKVAHLNAHPDESSSDVIEMVDGTIMERYSAPVRGSDGTYYGRVWTFHDITQRKNLEAQFLRAQRMESIGTLASGVAHDLNNILTPIMMSVSVLRMKMPEEKREGLFDTIEKSAARGAQIVKQVLTFGRGLEGERHPLQIGMLTTEMEQMIRSTFPKDIAVECVNGPDLWLVLGDATQLHQVLLNLCVNARDAMPAGGRLRLSAANLDIDASYASMLPEITPGPHVLLEVTDTGSGIPPEILERIFDPLFTTKGVGKGTGLGLSTVHGIVKSHGGLLKVITEPGVGTTFRVYLPAPPDQESIAGAAASTPPPKGHGELVLVVDDETTITDAARAVLEAHGYQVLLANDATEALVKLTDSPQEVAIVLTDIMMPTMSGVLFVRTLRKINADIPVIASTGVRDQAQLSILKELGMEAVLHKPYDASTLLRRIHAALHPGTPAGSRKERR